MTNATEPACLPFLRALGDENRWYIVQYLIQSETPVAVGDLAEALGLSLYNASRHARVLREAGIVSVTRDGRFKYLAIEPGFRSHLQASDHTAQLNLGCCQFDFDQDTEFRTKQLRQNASLSSLNQMPSARYIMIGGFLGAGKTTTVASLAKCFTGGGRRVGLITNDQGRELVDTQMLRSRGFATEEIAGGCFCCKFNSLVEAAGKLATGAKPEIFIAEPVGSCTDLVATVSYPLRRIYGEKFTIAPLTVLVDPARVRRVLGLEEGSTFSDKVLYIYRKQLEEADIIAISKVDLLTDAALAELKAALAKEYPQARILAISARTGAGMDELCEILQSEDQIPRQAMAVDYDVYADGEALLGWLNATIHISVTGEVDGSQLLESLAKEIQKRLNAQGAEVAHLKMTLSPDHALAGEVAVINLVRNDFQAEVCQELEEPVVGGQIVLNLRAEAAPEDLAEIVKQSLKSGALPGTSLKLDHLENFRPGRPVPTHRDA